MEADIKKENLDIYLRDLSKELKKEFGRNAEFEIIIIGGASILLNYNFRDTTLDVDMFISRNSSISTAIERVANKHQLSSDWMNSDFKYTESFSPKLHQYSKYYKTFNQILNVRTIKDEYLIAMKLVSFRTYKHDLSDIIGILQENQSITLEDIEVAFINLYGSLDKLSPRTRTFLEKEFKELTEITQVQDLEKKNLARLKTFEQKYKNTLNQDNVDDVLFDLNKKDKSVGIMDLFGNVDK